MRRKRKEQRSSGSPNELSSIMTDSDQVLDMSPTRRKMLNIRASQLLVQATAGHIASQFSKSATIRHEKQNSFVEFERQLDDLVQREQRKCTIDFRKPARNEAPQRRLSIFKHKLQNKLGHTDLLLTNRSLENLKDQYESERSRFLSRIDSDANDQDPYNLLKRKQEYSKSIRLVKKPKIVLPKVVPVKVDHSKELADEAQSLFIRNLTRSLQKTGSWDPQKVQLIISNRLPAQ